MIRKSVFCLAVLSTSISFLYAKCTNHPQKNTSIVVKSTDGSAISNLSIKLAALEKEWKMLDLKISHLSRQSTSISKEINAQNNAISQNMAEMISGNSKHENIVVSSCNKLTNDRLKKINNKRQELKKVREEINALKTQQNDVLANIDSTNFALKDKSKSPNTKDKLINDTIADIAKQSSDIPDLLTRIDLEISAGAFRRFVKCEAPSPRVHPVETLLVEKKVFQGNDKRFKFIEINASCRSGAFVFSPIFGTVVFYGNLLNLGNTVVIKNTNAYVVISGIDTPYFAIGKVVKKGHVIGSIKPTENTYSTIKYVIRVKSKKK